MYAKCRMCAKTWNISLLQKIPKQGYICPWEYDDSDNLIGMTQQPPPDYGLFTIPMSKAMLFRTESVKDNPEGRSILRNAYRSWYFKRRIQEIEAIGIERDLAGLPVIHCIMLMCIWNFSFWLVLFIF